MLPVGYARYRLLSSYPDVLSSHPDHLSALAFNTGFVFCHLSGHCSWFSGWLYQPLVLNFSLAFLVFMTDVLFSPFFFQFLLQLGNICLSRLSLLTILICLLPGQWSEPLYLQYPKIGRA